MAIIGAAAALAAFITAEAIPTPPTGNTPLWAYLLVGLAGFIAAVVGQLVFRRQTKDKLIAEASDEVAQGAKAILAEYRIALTDTQERLTEALAEVAQLRQHVAELEQKLAVGQQERRKLTEQLSERLDQIDELERQIHKLERQIHKLNRAVSPQLADDAGG